MNKTIELKNKENNRVLFTFNAPSVILRVIVPLEKLLHHGNEEKHHHGEGRREVRRGGRGKEREGSAGERGRERL